MQAVHEIFVPGRLCILGEHTDWAGEYRELNPTISYGMTIVCATNEGLYAKCSATSTKRLKFLHEEQVLDVPFDEDLLQIAAEGTTKSPTLYMKQISPRDLILQFKPNSKS